MTRGNQNRSGIYVIINAITGDQYIGSSIDVERRMAHHRALLSADRHPNQRLQGAWNEHGEPAFLFEVLELVLDPSRLDTIEQRYLDERQPSYNLAFIATRAAADLAILLRSTQRKTDRGKSLAQHAGVAWEIFNRLQRNDDIDAILAAHLALSPEKVQQIWYYRAFADVVYRSGVLSGQQFLNLLGAGANGLYGDVPMRERMARKGLDSEVELDTHLGSVEWTANEFVRVQMEQKVRNAHLHGYDEVAAACHETGVLIRELIQRIGGTMPEELPPQQDDFPESADNHQTLPGHASEAIMDMDDTKVAWVVVVS